MSTNVTFAKRLLELRLKHNLSQTKLAEDIHTTRVTISHYESEKRRPDCEIIVSLCKRLNVSADYLLGLTNTENQEYAEIAQTTGLDENAIVYMKNATNECRNLVNFLFREEPKYNMYEPDYSQSDNTDMIKSYQDYLDILAVEKENEKIHILEHLKNDWEFADGQHSYSDYIASLNEEELAEKMREEMDCFFPSDKNDYSNITPETFGPTDPEEIMKLSESFYQKFKDYEEKEAQKSNLLDAILNYVNYQSGCSLNTMSKTEKLTDEHSIYIGLGKNKTVQFPSKESDELFEFMLIQKVIDALKKFKKNYSNY